jgi:hypothetical protein
MYHGNKIDASCQASSLMPQAQAGNRAGAAAFGCPLSEAREPCPSKPAIILSRGSLFFPQRSFPNVPQKNEIFDCL